MQPLHEVGASFLTGPVSHAAYPFDIRIGELPFSRGIIVQGLVELV